MGQDTNKVLAISRIMVAWQPVGLCMGVYDMCNRYMRERQQFGVPLAAFQVPGPALHVSAFVRRKTLSLVVCSPMG